MFMSTTARRTLQAAVAFGDTTDACGEVTFTLPACASPGGRQIVCR